MDIVADLHESFERTIREAQDFAERGQFGDAQKWLRFADEKLTTLKNIAEHQGAAAVS